MKEMKKAEEHQFELLQQILDEIDAQPLYKKLWWDFKMYMQLFFWKISKYVRRWKKVN